MKELKAEKIIEVRFSEVDSMRVVWHGSYPLYFEDAREEFGRVHGLGYDTFINNRTFAPLVELSFQYKRPLTYGMKAKVIISYKWTAAAKIVFDYEIRSLDNQTLYATGRSMQVFMDMQYQLLWENPKFYAEWKRSKFPEQYVNQE